MQGDPATLGGLKVSEGAALVEQMMESGTAAQS
jgi:hypothetical protein